MIENLVILLISLGVLAKASEKVVESAVIISDYFKIGSLAIGFLLISFATSLPELSVSVISASSNQSSLAVGNALGSNIVNILLVIGIAAALYEVKVKKDGWLEPAIILGAVSVVSISLMLVSHLDFFGGLFLLVIFAFFVYYITNRKSADLHSNSPTKKETLVAFIYFSVSILFVLVSAGFAVETTVKLAELLGFAKSFIGSTLVAIGTSFPELAIVLQAARKKQYNLALGDIIGASINNSTIVLGIAAIIAPITFTREIVVILALFSLMANVMLVYMLYKHKKLGTFQGVFFLSVFVIYLTILFAVQLQIRD